MELRSAKLKEEAMKRIQNQIKNGKKRSLSVFRFGDNPGARSYEKGLKKTAEALGIDLRSFHYEKEEKRILEDFKKENEDPQVGGILLLEPIFPGIEEDLKRSLDPKKDLDGVSLINRGALFSGEEAYHVPATPRAALALLKSYEENLRGKEVLIINRTTVVGKPLIHLLLKEDATVTVCHSKTKDLAGHLKRADIVFTAMGRAHTIGPDDVKDGAVVIDIGLSMKEGTLCGDADYKAFKDSQVVTPVPGGVGALTNTLLLESLFKDF